MGHFVGLQVQNLYFSYIVKVNHFFNIVLRSIKLNQTRKGSLEPQLVESVSANGKFLQAFANFQYWTDADDIIVTDDQVLQILCPFWVIVKIF